MRLKLGTYVCVAFSLALVFALAGTGCGGSSTTMSGTFDGGFAGILGGTAMCTSDGLGCVVDTDCCSTACVSGTCKPLSTTCHTLSNACSQNSDCCSQLCLAGRCSNASSFCTQNGDACSSGPECCGGVCTIPTGGALGTCGSPPAGPTFCNGGMDGTPCGACNECCSRLCAPYGPFGVKICQPAQGCHIDGDLCTADTDCCGAPGTGLPGDGNVHCDIQPGFTVGICRNPMGCNPEGNVCHYKNYACAISSARNDCCGAPGNSGACQLDKLGVPRCHALGACVDAGGHCAFDSDCCNGGHCVPGPGGQLVCQTQCSPSAGPCTVNADCCSGLQCHVPPGSTNGTCGAPPLPPTTSDAGPRCAMYGQACTQMSDCCNNIPCTIRNGQGLCVSPIQ
jgi:hypothetical protein